MSEHSENDEDTGDESRPSTSSSSSCFKLKPKIYKQRYRQEWEKFPELREWLLKIEGNNTVAQCKFCKCTIAARLTDLKKHATRLKHQEAAKPFSCQRQQKIPFLPIKVCDGKSHAEARIALYTAVHTPILPIDHLTEVCNNVFKDCNLIPLRLHRTKATAIINNVLGTHFKKELIKDIGKSYYSLIIDESTDLTTCKRLGVIIKYYSENHRKFVSTYLSLVDLKSGTSEAIVEALINMLNEYKIDIHRLTGIGTDNASVMTGIHNGVYTALKENFGLNNLILVRCVCHSLQLAVSSATEESLPRNIEFLIRETYCWFNKSTKRQLAYENVYRLLNDDKKPLKIPQVSNTRWLSIEVAVSRIRKQFLELKTHFEIMRIQENCYTAEVLYSMYKDPINLVYLNFIHPILEEVQHVNKSFESSTSDPTKLHMDLTNLILSIAKRVINPGQFSKIDILKLDEYGSYIDPDPYLDYNFENACRENNISGDVKKNLKVRCFAFLCKLLKELKSRLPSNLSVFSKINILAVSECLKKIKPPITELGHNYIITKDILNQIGNMKSYITEETDYSDLNIGGLFD